MLGQPTRNPRPGDFVQAQTAQLSTAALSCLVLSEASYQQLYQEISQQSFDRVYKPITLVKTAFQNIQQLPQVHTNQQVFETL